MCDSIFKKILAYPASFPGQLILIPVIVLLSSCDAGLDTGADPGVEDFPIAYIKRAILVDDEGVIIQPDLRRPLRSSPGGDLYLKSRATISAPEISITQSITNGMGDVKDVEVSYDGKKLIFALQPEDPNPNDNIAPKWDIYTYDRTNNEPPVRVIGSDLLAAEGDDIAPYFLPDGRIVFSSNRQKQSRAILLDESVSKPQFSSTDENFQTKALVLHVMDGDGRNIKQISYNQSHDLDPIVLSDGRILFSRWDRMNRNNAISLYTILQDGSELQSYYGTHDESHQIPDVDDNSIQLMQPRELSDGRIMVLSLPYTGSFGGGEMVMVDGLNFVDLNQPTSANQGAMSSSAVESFFSNRLTFDDNIPVEGRYASFKPLRDGTSRILVSKGLCQLNIDISIDPTAPILETRPCIEPYISDPSATEAYPSYGLWIYNPDEQTEKPLKIVESGMFINEAVVMQPFDRPAINQGKTEAELDSDLVIENVGILNIRSVYDLGDGQFTGSFFNVSTSANVNDVMSLGDPGQVTADQRPARFIRLVKAVGLPLRRDPDLANPPNLSGQSFGRNGRRLGMKEILGYSEIQPDGSVRVKVPANIAFYFEILDKDARRIGPIHGNWLQVNAGDTLQCNGCHRHPGGNSPPLPLPHGRAGADAASINIAPVSGFYTNTQDPASGSPYLANTGDTMADALSRTLAVPALTPSVSVEYSDVWTDPAVRTPDADFSYLYSGTSGGNVYSLTTPSPTTAECETQWRAICRIVINYIEHIQPIWEVDRGANTCISCHTTDNAGVAVVPSAQLDLAETGPSDEQILQIESYRELFFNDNFQQLNGNALQDVLIQVQATDDNGNLLFDNSDPPQPIFEFIPDPSLRLLPSMSANGARASYFMEKMTETELNARRALSPVTVNHASMLTPAELRLIAEWLDIGGQYFNNPFDPAAP